jgi:hypothetical protein
MSCEDDLARAQTTLNDLMGSSRLAADDLTRLYNEYMDLLQRLNVSPERLKAEAAIPSGAVSGAAGVADLTGNAVALPESRPAAGASPVTLLQKRAAALGERVSRLEAKV